MPSIVQKLDELIVAAGGQPSGSGLPIDKKVEQARDAIANLNYQLRKPSIFASAVPGEDGLIVDYSIDLPENSLFCAFVSQYKFVYDNKHWPRFQFAVPSEFDGKCKVHVIGIKPSDEDVEVTTENTTIDLRKGVSNRTYQYALSSGLSAIGNGQYGLFRCVLELYDGDKVVREIYSPQVNCYNNNGTLEFTVKYIPEYDDVIVRAGIIKENSAKMFLYKRDSLDSIYSDELEGKIYMSSGAELYSEGKRKLIPYEDLSEDDILAPVLFVGNGDVILGNSIKPQLPSQSNSQGGN